MSNRSDWNANHQAIADAYEFLISENLRRPTAIQIAFITGLDEQTVYRHLRKLKFKPKKHPARVLTDSVLHGLAMKAMRGDAQAAKLWLQVMEGWSEKQSTEDEALDTSTLTALYNAALSATRRGDAPPDADTPGPEPQ